MNGNDTINIFNKTKKIINEIKKNKQPQFILLDTFKYPISLILPDIEFILESLYETLKDIALFVQDLF